MDTGLFCPVFPVFSYRCFSPVYRNLIQYGSTGIPRYEDLKPVAGAQLLYRAVVAATEKALVPDANMFGNSVTFLKHVPCGTSELPFEYLLLFSFLLLDSLINLLDFYLPRLQRVLLKCIDQAIRRLATLLALISDNLKEQ